MNKQLNLMYLLTLVSLSGLANDKFLLKVKKKLYKKKEVKDLIGPVDKIFEELTEKYKDTYLAIGYLLKLFYLNVDLSQIDLKTTTLDLSKKIYHKSENIHINKDTKEIFKDFSREFHKYLKIDFDENSLNLDDNKKIKIGRLRNVDDEDLELTPEIEFLRSLSLITKRNGSFRSVQFDNKIVLADNDFIGIFNFESENKAILETLLDLKSEQFYPISKTVHKHGKLYTIVGDRNSNKYYVLMYDLNKSSFIVNEIMSDTKIDKDVDFSGFSLKIKEDKLELLLIGVDRKYLNYLFIIDINDIKNTISSTYKISKQIKILDRKFMRDTFDFDIRFSIFKYIDDNILLKILTDTNTNKHKDLILYDNKKYYLNKGIFRDLTLVFDDDEHLYITKLKHPRILDLVDIEKLKERIKK